jgi:hypothetical protein
MAHLRDDRRWRLEARVTGAGYGGGEVRAGAVMRHRGGEVLAPRWCSGGGGDEGVPTRRQ